MSEGLSTRRSEKRTSNTVRTLTAEEVLSVEVPISSTVLSLPLETLVIENLLSFGEPTNFEFGRLNILVGPNGSGKSNLIDCVRILRYASFRIQEAFRDTGFEEWLFKGIGKDLPTAFLSATTHIPGISTPILHQLRFGKPVQSRPPLEETISPVGAEDNFYFTGSYRSSAEIMAVGTGRRRKGRTLGVDEYNSYESILSQIRDVGQYPEISRLSGLYSEFRIYSEWTFGRDSSLRESTPANRSSTTLSEKMDDLALVLNGLEKTAAHESIRVLLRELKPTYVDYITRVLFGRVGLDLIEAPFESPVPAKRLSDGTLRFLALAAILLQNTPPPLICLEEPELGMHPDMIRMVAKMIVDASSKAQILVTTHSEHLLTALQDDFDVLFAFDAGQEGSFVRRFSKQEYQEWSQENALGELWTSGELGGNRW